MLVLFETAAGFALFKVLNESKLKQVEDLSKEFENVDSASKLVSLKKFVKFKNTTDALKSARDLIESKLSKSLKKFLTKQIVEKDLKESLAVSDTKLGGIIKEKLGIKCIHNGSVEELMRGIRYQINNLLGVVGEGDMNAMSLGLSHSLSRYKLKFSPDKVDTMIVQAIGLLDDLDKELNTYSMRVREWYGWHFPELSKIIPDNILFARSVKLMGFRTNAATTDFSIFLPSELEEEVKEAAQISMGTEISDEDIENVIELCEQVISISEYRDQLGDYLRNRMQAIAPNLSVLVGELVGARLIAHAGSLMNLAKHPASTVQILGAEKALFRALKTKHETPKYGLIYHASLIGQAPPKYKGKIARVLGAKCALAIRCDALGEESNPTVGIEGRTKVEQRLKSLEGGQTHRLSGTGKGKKQFEKYDNKKTFDNQSRTGTSYSTSTDSTLGYTPTKSNGGVDGKQKKRKEPEIENNNNNNKEEEEEEEEPQQQEKEKKKKKKKKTSE